MQCICGFVAQEKYQSKYLFVNNSETDDRKSANIMDISRQSIERCHAMFRAHLLHILTVISLVMSPSFLQLVGRYCWDISRTALR